MRQKEGICMTHFYIIRHGETVFNRKGRIQGWCDSPLTDLGISQAKQLGKELKSIPFDVCFCSTSERAIDTANYILEGRNVKIIPTKKLKEQSFGDFEAEKSVNIFKDGVSFPDGYRFCTHQKSTIQYLSNSRPQRCICLSVNGLYRYRS